MNWTIIDGYLKDNNMGIFKINDIITPKHTFQGFIKGKQYKVIDYLGLEVVSNDGSKSLDKLSLAIYSKFELYGPTIVIKEEKDYYTWLAGDRII